MRIDVHSFTCLYISVVIVLFVSKKKGKFCQCIYQLSVIFQIPSRASAVSSFYDLLSPAPSTCSVESTEALLRDLVDIYTCSEPITHSPPSTTSDLSDVHGFNDEKRLQSQEELSQEDEKFFRQVTDEYLQPAKQEPIDDHNSTYTPPQQPQDRDYHDPVFPPLLPNYPTGGPPEIPEPSLLSGVASRSKPLGQALQTECRTNILPLSLIQAATSHDTQPPSLVPLSTRSGMLQTKLLSLEKTHKTKTDHLHLFFQLQAARIESDRANHLCDSIQTPNLLPAVNQYFDMQYHALIDNIELQIHCLQYQFFSHNSMPSLSSSTCHNDQTPQPLDEKPAGHYQRQKKTKPPPLNKVAIRIMTNWYERNIHHPYPCNDSAEIMAKAGNITAEQVKKWFANKRMRNANTKPQRAAAAAKAGLRPLDDGHIVDQQLFKRIRLH